MDNNGDKEKLAEAFREVIWMAMRYANGRQTYAPSAVRMAIGWYQEVYPDWRPKHDKTLARDRQYTRARAGNDSRDWLDDLTEDPEGDA